MSTKIKFCCFCLLSFVGLAVYFGFVGRQAIYVKVVEFAYSRVQPCNTKYYNYDFSIEPLQDWFKVWSGNGSVGNSGFVKKVQTHVMASSKLVDSTSVGPSLVDICKSVAFSLAGDKNVTNPIRCKMTIRAPSKKLVETLARSYVEVMLKEMALENQSLAWKATMNYGLAYKKATQELKVLRDKLAVTDLPANQKEQLFERIATLKVSVDKAKAVWNAKQKSYREMWDASIVFQSW